MGRNILPSVPCRVSTGRKTTVMIAMPKTIGRATCFADFSIITCRSTLLRGRPSSCPFSDSRLMLDSVITTEPSTMIPKSIAPRLRRLAAIANSYIPMMAKSMARGITAATNSPARRLPKRTKRINTTRIAPAIKLCLTVRMTWAVSSVRS